ncbi:MFS transporter [Streptococcus orisratti]|uniref:MFS transporter n=1 Tax=Streptococcus orisratti TaxID=114652 RepID=UPI003D01C9A0
MKKLLKNKLYMLTFVNDMLSNFGDVVYYLALMSYVLQLPDAKLAISIVSISETLPILAGFVMGYFADRTTDKIKTILKTLYFRTGIYLLIGVVIGFKPSLWIVILAAFINFLSDLAGQYENGLYTPLSLRVVADEDRSDSYAFRQAAAAILYIGFQSAGAALVTVMSYQALAFVNAGTFALCTLIMLGLKPSLEKLLVERPLEITKEVKGNLVKDMWNSMKLALRECLKLPEMRQSMVVVPVLNGVLNVVTIIIPVIISQDKHFTIGNAVTTLALLTIFNLLGGILGNILAMTILKKLDLTLAIRLVTLLVPVFFFFIYIHEIHGVYATIFLITILAGAINPKFAALIANSMPEDKLAMISGGVNTYFQIGSMLSRLVVAGLIVVLPIDVISLIFLFIGFALVVYAYRGKIREVVA